MDERLDNPRHEAFCVYYAECGCAASAYRRAYGKRSSIDKSVRNCAARLLADVGIKNRIRSLRKKIDDKREEVAFLSLKEKRQFLAEVVRTPVGQVDGQSKLCQSVKLTETLTEYKMPDKLRALELDAKLAGELTEKVEHSGSVAVPMSLDQFRKRAAEAKE